MSNALTTTQEHAAQLLGVSRWTVARGMDDGSIPFVQLRKDGPRKVPVQWLRDTLGVDDLPPPHMEL